MALTEQALTALWSRYSKQHSREDRDALVENYMELVNIIGGRLAISLPSFVDRDDLISSGYFGLLDAVDRFEPERKVKFETFASIRIRGAMLDYLRSQDWVPASLRAQIRNYEDTLCHLELKLGRSATDDEVADALGMDLCDYQRLLSKMNVATVIPLDDYVRTEMPNENSPNDPAKIVDKAVLREALAGAIHELPERERHIVSLYYYEELTMKEIGLVMHISEARVCQLHTRAIFRLRGHLARTRMTEI